MMAMGHRIILDTSAVAMVVMWGIRMYQMSAHAIQVIPAINKLKVIFFLLGTRFKYFLNMTTVEGLGPHFS